MRYYLLVAVAVLFIQQTSISQWLLYIFTMAVVQDLDDNITASCFDVIWRCSTSVLVVAFAKISAPICVKGKGTYLGINHSDAATVIYTTWIQHPTVNVRASSRGINWSVGHNLGVHGRDCYHAWVSWWLLNESKRNKWVVVHRGAWIT
jgi:hypothetical protein